MTRRATVLLVALLVGHALLAYQVRARGIFTFGDDAAYLLLSRALRAFSYREVQFIGEPIAARFPPAYPALLAVLGVFGENIGLISLVGIAISVSGLYALFDVIRRRWSGELALLVIAVAAVNPTMVANAGAIASEGTFTALALWTLWAADRTDHGERRGVAAAAVAILAAMTRTAGVTLPLALGAHWLLRRRVRHVAVLALASAVTVGAWLGWTTFAPKREFRRSYIDDAVNVRSGDGSMLGTLAYRLSNNASTYVGQTLLTELSLPVAKGTKLDNVAWVALLGSLMLAGLVSAWRRWNVAVIWAAGYATLLVIWAFTLERFLQPLMPVLIAFVLVGAWTVVSRWRPRNPRAAALPAVAVSAVLAGSALLGSASLSERAAACDRSRTDCAPPESLDYVDASIYVASHSPPDARFIAPKNATLYYFAPRQSVFWDEVIVQDSSTFLGFLDRNRVTHVLTTPVFSDQVTLARLAFMHCAQFDLLRAVSPETMILVRRSAPSDGNTQACRALARAVKRAERRTDPGDSGNTVQDPSRALSHWSVSTMNGRGSSARSVSLRSRRRHTRKSRTRRPRVGALGGSDNRSAE